MKVRVEGHEAEIPPARRQGMTRRSVVAFVPAAVVVAVTLPAVPAHAQSSTLECAADLVVS